MLSEEHLDVETQLALGFLDYLMLVSVTHTYTCARTHTHTHTHMYEQPYVASDTHAMSRVLIWIVWCVRVCVFVCV